MKVDNKAPNVMEFLPGDTTFGRATLSATTAKECLWPVRQEGEAEFDEEEVRTTFYLKSHNRTNPGTETSTLFRTISNVFLALMAVTCSTEWSYLLGADWCV